jgi:hypothetical protein
MASGVAYKRAAKYASAAYWKAPGRAGRYELAGTATLGGTLFTQFSPGLSNR